MSKQFAAEHSASSAPPVFRPHDYQVEPAELEATLTPGLASAAMFRAIYSTVDTQRGVGFALRTALIIDRHRAELEFPLAMRIPLGLLARVARLLGVRVD